MGEIIRVVGPLVSQLVLLSTETLVADTEITVRAPIPVALVQGYLMWINDTNQGSQIHEVQLARNLVIEANSRDRRKSRAVVGGLQTNFISMLMENLVPGDVVNVVARHDWAGNNFVLLSTCELRAIAFGPEIRAQGIFEDTG